MKLEKLGNIATIKTGKYDVNHSTPDGEYAFYTCAFGQFKSPTYSFEGPAIILPGNGANVGEVFFYDGKFEAYQRTYVVQNFKADPNYIYAYFKAQWKNSLRNKQFGSATNYIRLNNLTDFTIPLPPLPDQLHIANLLSKAENLIAQRKESIRLLDEFLKSTFLEMFGDPLINSKQWRIIKIKDCGKIVTGTTPPSSKDGMFGGEIPFITPSDLESDEPNRRFVTELGAKNSRTVRKGATFICCIGATIGKVQRAKVLSAFNQQLNAIEWNNDFNDLFGERLMRFMKPRIIAKGGASTTLPILNKGDFEKIEIIHPPIELQTRFAQIVEKTEALKSQYQQSLQELENLYGSLSQKAFRGELTKK